MRNKSPELKQLNFIDYFFFHKMVAPAVVATALSGF
jgi:hypothetical protein